MLRRVVEDPNRFHCLCCEREANSDPQKVAANSYAVEDREGKLLLIGVCAFCKALGLTHQRYRRREDGVALELRELQELVRANIRRGMSADVARMQAVEQQVRAEDLDHIGFMEWLHKAGRM